MADMIGKSQGDEYFADLDLFVKACEEKEGYESSAEQPDSDAGGSPTSSSSVIICDNNNGVMSPQE